MFSMRVASLALWLSVGLLGPALAAEKGTPLNVKSGLWEMTSDSESSGRPPIPPEALAQMSPEQRAKLEAAIAGSMGPRHQVQQHCVTRDDIANGFDRMTQMSRGQCTQNVTSSSATLREGRFICTGGGNASGTYRFEARSPEAVVAYWDMTMSNGANTMKMKSAMQGKWLGPDCGDVGR